VTLYLLDSCVVIDILRGRADRVAGVQRLLGVGDLAACAITVAEVRSGMRPKEETATLALLKSLRFLDLSAEGSLKAGSWRAGYRTTGVTLSLADCLVAATAVEHAATLVTDNVSHYPQPELVILAANQM